MSQTEEIKKIENGCITMPKGFQAAGLRAGIKPGKTKKDMALVISAVPCAAAGVFTRNLVKAAPVQWDSAMLQKNGVAQAVVINSGIANACTGEEGYRNVQTTAECVAKEFGIQTEQVMVMSTGVIGQPLPMDIICQGVGKLHQALGNDEQSGHDAAEAILTTDTHAKEIAVSFELNGTPVKMAGMCKGSGMIHPNMGTMLGIITTDAMISQPLLNQALKELVEDTFNMVSVDGDTSTNDMVTILANGLAGNAEITCEGEDFTGFMQALNTVTVHLCRCIAGDGEGATKLLECKVSGAQTEQIAKTVAKSVICSSLTKAAMFGADANWGRVLCAIGYSGAPVDVQKIDVQFASKAGTILVCQNGAGVSFSEEQAKKILLEQEIEILIDLKSGGFSSTAWGCDLTYDYVKINGDYRT